MTDELSVAIAIRTAFDKAKRDLNDIQDKFRGLNSAGATAQRGTADAASGMDQVSASADRISDAVRRAGDNLTATTTQAASRARSNMAHLGASLDRVTYGVQQQGADLLVLDDIMEGTAKSIEDIAEQERALDRLMRAGTITHEQQADALDALTARENRLGGAKRARAKDTRDSANATRGFSFANQEATQSYTALMNAMAAGRMGDIPGVLATMASRVGAAKLLFSGLGAAVAAASVSLGGYAALSFVAAREQQQMNNAVIATGGSLGITTGRLRTWIAELAAGNITFGDARDAIMAIARSGRFSGEQIKIAAEGAIAMSELLGEGIEESAKKFIQLADDPVEAIKKLDNDYHFLTASVYDQITALQQEGDSAGALQLALEALHDSQVTRNNESEESAARMIKLWSGVQDIFGDWWEGTKSVFRTDEPEDELRALEERIDELRARGAPPELLQQLAARLPVLRREIAALNSDAEDERRTARLNQGYRQAVDHVNELKAQLDKTVRLEQELARLAREKQAIADLANAEDAPAEDRAAAQAKLAGEDWDALEAAIRERYEESGQSAVATHKEQLAQLIADQSVGYDERLQFELKFWTEQLAAAEQGTKDYAQIYAIRLSLLQQADNERLAAAREEETKLRELRQLKIDGERDAGLAQISTADQVLAFRLRMGEISKQQELAQTAELEDQKFQIKLAALQRERALIDPAGEPQALARNQQQIEQLATQHGLRMQKIQQDLVVATRDRYRKMMDPIGQAFDQSIRGIIQGTQTAEGAMANLLDSTAQRFVSTGVEMVLNHAANQAAMTGATAAGEGARTAIVTSAAATEKALTIDNAITAILANAWKAASATYASISAIPVVGPALAPAAAIGAAGAIANYVLNVDSAENGYWRIPSDRLVSIHEHEMVIPAREAEGLRNLIEGNRGGSGGDTIIIQAADARSFEQMLERNPRALERAIAKARRNRTIK